MSRFRSWRAKHKDKMLKVPLEEFESEGEMDRDRCTNEPLTPSSPPLIATSGSEVREIYGVS